MTTEYSNSGDDAAERKSIASASIIRTKSTIPSSKTEHYGKKKQRKLARRLGPATAAILVAATLLNVFVLGVLSFLWYGNSSSTLWHRIMLRGWATRAVTVPALILRTAVDLQAGVATAMIAALSLEHGIVPFNDVAKWSIARASKPRPRTFLFPSFRSNSRSLDKRKLATVIPILTLCGTVLILQFTSTILFSDFGTGVLRSDAEEISFLYNYIYPSLGSWGTLPGGWDWVLLDPSRYPQTHRTTTWLRNPPAFPTFAEYSMPVTSPRHNVDDTGVLLRAFLPYADATLRQNISEFEGKTIVLDSRVSCQKPMLANLTAKEQRSAYSEITDYPFTNESFTAVQINGTVAPSEANADRLVRIPAGNRVTRTTWFPRGALL
jgi:hypothetical protein